jgi:hypothetical protein
MSIEAFIERFSRGTSPTKQEESALMIGRILMAKASAAHFYPVYVQHAFLDSPDMEVDSDPSF